VTVGGAVDLELPIAALRDRIAAGELSARAAVEAYLARIDRLDGTGAEGLGAYLAIDAGRARADADRIDAAAAAGQPAGALAGVPIAVKDVLVTEGLATTAASKILAGWIPPYDGTVIAKLRAAGAVILGKLNCDEFAMGSSTERSAYRPCRNPWDPSRVPGGSSGGSAVAVAARLCAGSLGTDTGGSIRQPAAWCGVVGLKPTYGRVSRYGVVAFASSLDQVGPFGRTVEDAAVMLEAIAGFDPRDATSIDAPVPRYRDAVGRGAAGLRIGLPREYLPAELDGAVRAGLDRAAAALRDAGAELVEISLPHTELALATYYLIAPAEAASNLARYDGVRYGARAPGATLAEMYAATRGAGFGPEVKRRIMLGTYALRAGYYDAYYRKAQQVRALITRDFAQAWTRCDAVLTPVTPAPAFAIGATTSPLEMYLGDVFTLACNLAGLPGISVPCGTAHGLPIGAQLMAPPLAEETVIAAAAVIERALGTGGIPAGAA
jgi:aspartyl-tRNA(Asn)/glutamyl-tRNA(Gln) amidotransferase subunit A